MDRYQTQWIPAFADNILFFMEDPQISIPTLIKKINEFGNLTGSYINKKKSKLLCKNMIKKQKDDLMELAQCEVANKVKYLGINIKQYRHIKTTMKICRRE